MKSTADVVIIGGGVAGVSALYHLAEAGLSDVVLVEMERVGSGTTGHTAAYVLLQDPDDLISRISLLSYPEIRSFEQRFGIDIGFRRKGSISVDVSEHNDLMLERAELQESIGIPTEVLTPAEIKSIAPFLNVSDLGVGLLCEEGEPGRPVPLMHTYVKRATNKGACVKEEVKATGIGVEKGRVVGVQTTKGFVSTPAVINAAGVYASLVGSWVGIDIPIINALRHTLRMESSPHVPEGIPLLEVLNPEEIYIETIGNHLDFSLGFQVTDSFVHRADLEGLVKDYGDAMIHRMPLTRSLGVVFCEAGIRSMTPDGLPILGPVDSISGYFNDCGWGGRGISLAPIGGKLLAQSVAGTTELAVPIDPFLLRRFRET